jgi:hypothetical protein
MKKYKLIKKLPFEGSPAIGYISEEKKGESGAHYWNHNWFHPEDYPEYWEEVVKLCVPIGTKFTVREGSKVYIIKEVMKDLVYITWESCYDSPGIYTIDDVNRYFKDGTWKIYIDKPVLFITEDGKELREGDKYWYLPSYNHTLIESIMCASNKAMSLGAIRFSTKEAAQKYVDDNKPIYSIRDVAAAFENLAWDSFSLEKFLLELRRIK